MGFRTCVDNLINLHGCSSGVIAILFGGQLILNLLWPYLFFYIRRPDLAFYEIGALWISILATLISFWKVNPIAGGLLVPYLFWVLFASYLNGKIWQLNRSS